MPFDFSRAMGELMADVATVLDELRHVDVSRIAVGFSQARHGGLHGTFATTHALRFGKGALETTLEGRTYAFPRVIIGGVEALYAIIFRLPRFLNLPLDEKMATVVHEMYHISPAFDGTLRRFEGGKPYHTGSRRRYHAAMGQLARSYQAATRRPELHAFLRQDFSQLSAAHGGIVGLRLRRLGARRVGKGIRDA